MSNKKRISFIALIFFKFISLFLAVFFVTFYVYVMFLSATGKSITKFASSIPNFSFGLSLGFPGTLESSDSYLLSFSIYTFINIFLSFFSFNLFKELAKLLSLGLENRNSITVLTKLWSSQIMLLIITIIQIIFTFFITHQEINLDTLGFQFALLVITKITINSKQKVVTSGSLENDQASQVTSPNN